MSDFTHGKILPRDVSTEMKQSYMDYAMSVIVSRALPDVRDGLKPVHRRILYAMNELGLLPTKGYKKSARIVGEVLGKYHPHGDAALYDTMVRMAQDFSYRYPLIDGHGNFGSIDGDPAAAMRYTEVRMDKFATILLADLEKETVDFAPNFDDTLKEPVVLPARFPNLLVNGASGIAVGMSTNIPPHNLREAIEALNVLIDNPDITVDGLLKYLRGPDFPTAGIILGKEGIKKAYKTGRGAITLRGEVKIETVANGKQSLVITELPYQVNKARLIEKIAELVREKKIDGITDLRDETDRNGIRVVVELRKDTNPHVILNQLYKNTQLQQNYSIIMLALVDNQPRILPLKELLVHYLNHQRQIITRRTEYDLKKAEDRQHVLAGFKIALANLDRIIAIIRQSKDPESARKCLQKEFPLSQIQAQAILDMRLQRLTALEREKIEQEYQDLTGMIRQFKEILTDPKKIDAIIRSELNEIKEKYGDERRTRIVNKDGELEIEDLIAEEDVVITITHQGYIKRMPVTSYRSQRRGGRGVSVHKRQDDFVRHMFITSTHNNILFFTNHGQVYRKKVYEIPEAGRQARGTALVNLVPLRSTEWVSAVIQVKEFSADQYLVMATQKGFVKKTSLDQFDTNLKSGVIGIKLDDKDALVGVLLTRGDQEVMLFTSQGLAIRFNEKDIRPMGRVARGVKGITLASGDQLVEMTAVKQGNGSVLIVTEHGYGKRTQFSEFRTQTRGGKGIKATSVNEKSGLVVGGKLVSEGDDIMIVTAGGLLIRQRVDDISVMGRSARGLRLIRLNEGDRVVAVARVVREEKTENHGGV